MPALKNIRHEQFARNLLAMTKTGGTQGNAYSKAGFKSEGAAADVCASKLLKITNGIAKRVEELMQNGAKRAEVTVQSLLAELEEARAWCAGRQAVRHLLAVVRCAAASVSAMPRERPWPNWHWNTTVARPRSGEPCSDSEMAAGAFCLLAAVGAGFRENESTACAESPRGGLRSVALGRGIQNRKANGRAQGQNPPIWRVAKKHHGQNSAQCQNPDRI